jgi:hypothetical protein
VRKDLVFLVRRDLVRRDLVRRTDRASLLKFVVDPQPESPLLRSLPPRMYK